MATIRQEKISELIQQELSIIFQKEARNICLGAMVSTTIVRVAPDLSTAKVYLSIFGNKDKEASYALALRNLHPYSQEYLEYKKALQNNNNL